MPTRNGAGSNSLRSELSSKNFNPETETVPFFVPRDKADGAYAKYDYKQLVALRKTYEKTSKDLNDEGRLSAFDTLSNIEEAISKREETYEKALKLFENEAGYGNPPSFSQGKPSGPLSSYERAVRNRVQIDSDSINYDERKKVWDDGIKDILLKTTGIDASKKGWENKLKDTNAKKFEQFFRYVDLAENANNVPNENRPLFFSKAFRIK